MGVLEEVSNACSLKSMGHLAFLPPDLVVAMAALHRADGNSIASQRWSTETGNCSRKVMQVNGNTIMV